MRFGQSLLIVILSVIFSSGAAYYFIGARLGGRAALPVKESRLDHIKHTGVLRCGYVIWPPVLMKDPNTGQMSGMFYDLVEEIGKQLSVKIEWTTEMAAGQAFADLALNRYDMGCMAFFITPGRAREGSFTIPILYWPTYLFARADDTRFDNNYDKANDPGVTFATQDGDFSSIGAHEFFPKAATASIPQISSSAEFFNLVSSKKADLVVTEPLTYLDYLKNNPGIVRQVKGKPIFVGTIGMPMPSKEPDLKEAIDGTLIYLQGLGFIDRLINKYETSEIKFFHLTKPYIDTTETAP